MKSIILKPIEIINGSIDLPGSKSISNRALLLASLSKGTTFLTNLLDSDDTRHMLNAIKSLGIYCKLSKNRTYCTITGNINAFESNNATTIFLGNSGTAMRFLTAALCIRKNDITLDCDTRMKNRPIGHLVDSLRQGGAKIDYLEREYYPPLQLKDKLNGGFISINGSLSSQFLTALLISLPLISQNTIITVTNNITSRPYIDITLNLIKKFGILIENQEYKRFIIHGNQQYRSPGNYFIEGDASSASYFLAASAIKGGTVRIKGISSNSIQGDIAFAYVLQSMGAVITWGDNFIDCTYGGRLYPIDIDMNSIPDVAMTLAITALFAKGTSTIRNIYNWRIKETDRIFAMATELRKVGAIIEEGNDYIRITPPTFFQFAEINTYKDHRIAMCFSLISLSGIPVKILNPKCVTKTFPNYFKQFHKISKFL